jgi:hypothetical protein
LRGLTEALDRPFFLVMSVVIALVVAYGFSFTIGDNLLHPPYPRPWVLHAHALAASTWVPLLIVQATLVRLRKVHIHRSLGYWGMVHGAMVPISGIAAGIAMAKLRLAHGDPDGALSFPIPVNDAFAFAAVFALGAFWRKRPELHRRLMFLAACVLTGAAFGRMPALEHAEWFYAGVDALILVAVLRDLAVMGRVHSVYRFGLPAIVGGQLITAYVRWTPLWLESAPRFFR